MPRFPSFAAAVPLLAEIANRFESLGSRFRPSDSTFPFAKLIGCLVGIATIAAVTWLAARWYVRSTTRVVNDPRALCRELCRAHRLSRAQRRLLLQIAEWHGLSDPVQLFLEPTRFQSAELLAAIDCAGAVTDLQARLFSVLGE